MIDVMQTSVVDPIEDNQDLNRANEVSGILTLGGQLSTSRQDKKWTVQFVAEQLKLSQAQILALESNNFEALPKMVIVRGFVRAYAKLLKIDSDNLVALLPQDATPVQLESSLRPALSTPFVESRLSLLGQHDNNRRYIIGAIFLVVVVVTFLVLQATEFGRSFRTVFDKEDSKGEESVVLQTPQENQAQNMASSLSQSANSSSGASASLPVVEVASSKSITSDVRTPKNEDGMQPVVMSSSQPAVGVEIVTAPTSLPPLTELFVLKFRQDSWIQVKTESGTVLSSHLAKAGTEESFSVKQSLYVKLGNAAGVDAVLRGMPMSVTSERGNNVANLVVK
ncbi:helix-turn-helix domain-containing protein [Undibacterium sp.]|uniref:helix-turn-helix domain-containing protein n=1 Tax=Undibacterium sp. TaxID=1914977 RepID=UPI003753974A